MQWDDSNKILFDYIFLYILTVIYKISLNVRINSLILLGDDAIQLITRFYRSLLFHQTCFIGIYNRII